MITMDEYMSLAEKIEFSHGDDEPGIRHAEKGKMTTVYGYNKEGKLLFFAKYDENGDFRLSLYSDKTQTKEDLYSDEIDDLFLSSHRKKQLADAKKFIDKLKTKEQQDTRQSPLSLADAIQKGINVKLSPETRLSFAPDIENLQISKDENGTLHMSGVSKDGKQCIDFAVRDGNIEFKLSDGDVSRSYNNKIGGKFTWRDLKSPAGTRYFDVNGDVYAKEMAGIMNKVKTQYQTRSQSNTPHLSQNNLKTGGR